MTTVGLLHPAHGAEDDYPRLEVLLDSDIRLPIVHTDAPGPGGDAEAALGPAGRLTEQVAELRLAGAESVVWASAEESFGHGWEGAHRQIRALARAAGLPASSTAFGFVHAVRKLGTRPVAVGTAGPSARAALFAEFLAAGGVEVVATHAGAARAGDAPGALTGGAPAAEPVESWDRAAVLELARAADRPEAAAVLLPDTGLHTVAHLADLEKLLGKPVLTAHQVTVWEGLRLAERRAWAFDLGTLFAKPGEDGTPGAAGTGTADDTRRNPADPGPRARAHTRPRPPHGPE
ncbi:decarboxylase [Streptomyces sp. CAU 1734]|uniref:aspartate racemase/maleate isomerase family protein n=1 Tax=Streptomyces sp. CAU 1734 TaxID=3140360 RepID=UPI0032609E67